MDKKEQLRKSLDNVFRHEDKLRALLRKRDRIWTKENLEGCTIESGNERAKIRQQIETKTADLKELRKNHDELRNRLLGRCQR